MPEIAPSDVEKARPEGNVGVIDQEVTVPPLDVGITVVISEPFESVNEFGV